MFAPVAVALLFAGPAPRAIAQIAPVLAAADDRATEPYDDEDENPYVPGLVAHYRHAGGSQAIRLEERLAHTWGAAAPDRRLPAGPFTAQFRGRLWTQAPGSYTLRVFAAGTVRLKLAGQLLLDARAVQPRWLSAEPVELPFGYHPLEIEYRRDGEQSQLTLYWKGPQFALEPVAARWLVHDRGETPADDFERGERLVRALRCAACHPISGEATALRAAALDRLAGNLARDWLVERLSAERALPADDGSLDARRMPHFALQKPQAEAIADALLAASAPPGKVAAKKPAVKTSVKTPGSKKRKKDKVDVPPPPAPSLAAGENLFRSVGCLACHRAGGLGADGLFGGGDLSHVARKRPADFFARWLADPAAINRHHRMPVFALEDHELASLSLYLAALGERNMPVVTKTASTAGNAALGGHLIEQARCAACHALPDQLVPARALAPIAIKPGAMARSDDSCLGEPEADGLRPGYGLNTADRRAIATFLQALDRAAAPSQAVGPADLLAENNCLACHRRDASPGLAAQFPALAAADAQLSGVLAALEPPALFGVGDKLHDKALAQAIVTPERPRRAWLRVRMPKFPLEPDDVECLAAYFVAADRIPLRDEPATKSVELAAALEAAGPRLVTADGFGCTSCHAIGDWTPQKVALNAQGTPLDEVGRRIRREWFDRWVRNPSRIVPNMEMPAVTQSIRGVLDRRLDDQLAAVWHVLNRPDFTPPAPGALRVVRRSNLDDVAEPPAVITDLVEIDGQRFVVPVVVGLRNRHNLLFDQATNRLAAWWLGDTARQSTRGKSWFWEAGVPQLLPLVKKGPATASELVLVHDGQRLEPLVAGQYPTEINSLATALPGDNAAGDVVLTYDVRFTVDGRPRPIHVTQAFSASAPDSATSGSGFDRSLQLHGLPAGAAAELLVLAGDAQLDPSHARATLHHAGNVVEVSLQGPGPGVRFEHTPRGAAVVLEPAADTGDVSCVLTYRSSLAADQFAPVPVADRSVDEFELDVVPGYQAVRLGVTDQAMPTGLAWRADGTLVVSSLEGRVWLGRDTDGDQLEDVLEPYSDDLPAPYGVATTGPAIDVITKLGLVRLSDDASGRRAGHLQLLTSGWGHTTDYHDWAVGLPRDAAGNYYVALACQQDNRSEVAAHLRGKIVRLEPRAATPDDPHVFGIHEICGGLRFPQGIARSAEGELFVTDQQGHYNPFNELNHIVPGARYGFINRLEAERGLKPPATPPAVAIPHPWTRSVNGICFLETPAAVREASPNHFGPFEGHLVGCEYNNRKLVRISLQRVDDTLQGAVYPLSREPAPGGETFEGPLVCQVAPDGDLYVGNIHDSGWGAGSNTGSLVRLRPAGQLPAGIAEVRAVPGGFALHFTAPVDRQAAARADSYSLASYRRQSTPQYGGDDLERRVEPIASVTVSDDARSVTLALDELREGFVYEFHLRNLAGGAAFFPDEAYYTLRKRVP